VYEGIFNPESGQLFIEGEGKLQDTMDLILNRCEDANDFDSCLQRAEPDSPFCVVHKKLNLPGYRGDIVDPSMKIADYKDYFASDPIGSIYKPKGGRLTLEVCKVAYTKARIHQLFADSDMLVGEWMF
jgi:hypothetical protein